MSKTLPLHRFIPIALVCAAELSLTAAGFFAARLLERRRAEIAFSERADERIDAVRRAIQAQQDGMYAVKVFFDLTGTAAREQFRALAGPLLTRIEGSQALEWIPRVTGAERARYERRARKHGFPDFTFTERGPGQSMVPAGQRDEYFPVYYVEPYVGNEMALGFDLASDRRRRRALMRARDEGRVISTARVILVQETGNQYGTVIFMPRYFPGTAPATVDERRRRLAGFVVGVFRIGDMLDTAMSYFEPGGIDVAILDDSSPPAERLLAFHRSRTRARDDLVSHEDVFSNPSFLRKVTFDVGGRAWSIACVPTAGFLAGHTTGLPWFVLGAGFLVLALSVRYMQIQGARRAALEALVQSEGALRESEHRYRTLVENAPEAIVVLDTDQQRFVDANDNAVELFKVSREELLQIGPAEVSPPEQPDGRSSREAAAELIRRALVGEVQVFEWTHRDREGRDFPCEVRLVRFPPTSRALVRGSVTDITVRKEAEQRQGLLMRELDHRVKNNLAAVLSLAEQTANAAGSLEEFTESFLGRIRALARLHGALARREWEGVELGEIVRINLEAFMRSERPGVTLDGVEVQFPARAGTPVCMTLHELTTNAAKYGAMSTPDGSLHVSWGYDGDHRVQLTWRETVGSPVSPPTRQGVGMRLIKGLIEYELGGTVVIEFLPEGLACRMTLPTQDARGADGAAESRQ